MTHNASIHSSIRIPRDWGVWAVIGLTGLALFALPFSNSVFAPGALLALVGIGILIRHFRAIWAEPWMRWMLVLMAALWLPQVLALTGAINFERALRTASTYPLYALSMVPLLWLVRQRDIVTPLLYLTLALAVIWSLDGLLQFVTGSNILGYPYNGRRVAGLFYPDLSLGIVLAHLLPLVLEASRRLAEKNRLSALLPILVIGVIILSGSRSAILMMLISISIYASFLVWFYRPRILTVVTVLAAVATGLAATLWVSPEARDRVTVVSRIAELNLEGVDAATSKRGTIWVAAWQVAADEPVLGVGVRGVEPAAHARGYTDMRFAHVHLYGLDVLAATGWVGLVSYLLGFAAILWVLIRSAFRHKPLSPLFAMAALGVIAAFNPLNAHWTIYSSYAASIGWITVGIGLAALVSRKPPSAKT